MVTLIINRSDSRCGGCGASASPYEDAHVSRLGYTPGKGCGEPWDSVSSDYFGMDDSIKAMRPDLPWIDPLERLNIELPRR